MKFTGELKKKLEAAASKEEAHKLLNDVGLELTDEELAGIAGGWSWIRGLIQNSIPADMLPDEEQPNVIPPKDGKRPSWYPFASQGGQS